MCDSKELLVSYLYDELDAAEREEARRHLASCAECRAEVAGLRATQRHLATWAPPEPDLGFRIVRNSAPRRPRLPHAPGALSGGSPRRLSWCLRRAPRLRISTCATTRRICHAHRLEPSGRRAVPRASRRRRGGVEVVDWKQQAEALNRACGSSKPHGCPRSRPGSAKPSGPRPCSARESSWSIESEARQQRVMAARLSQLTRDLDARRKVDLAVIDPGVDAPPEHERR